MYIYIIIYKYKLTYVCISIIIKLYIYIYITIMIKRDLLGKLCRMNHSREEGIASITYIIN